ncbi:MAG: UvrD-helicase domain-containing protein, partial [Desulforhopalus sp.]
MKVDYTIFDVGRARFSKGTTLIEASAGTGKTYAIGMLVLRAVVELGISIEKILIVTFTKAATEELKSRIRTRLVEARDMLGNSSDWGDSPVDETLAAWVSDIQDKETALRRLQLAIYDIDLASIFTIHGFCQRMLMEQALESGQLFEVELLTDIGNVRQQVAEDFWRRVIYPMDRSGCSLLISSFPTPVELLASVSLVFGHAGEICPPVGSIEEAVAQFKGARENLDSWWSVHHDKLHECFKDGLLGGFFKKDFTRNFDLWFGAVADFLEGRTDVVPNNIHLLDRQLLHEELNGNKLRGSEKKQAFLADFPLSESEVTNFLAGSENLLLTLRVHLAHEIRHEVSSRLESSGQMGFDDLIQRLAEGLQGNKGQY